MIFHMCEAVPVAVERVFSAELLLKRVSRLKSQKLMQVEECIKDKAC